VDAAGRVLNPTRFRTRYRGATRSHESTRDLAFLHPRQELDSAGWPRRKADAPPQPVEFGGLKEGYGWSLIVASPSPEEAYSRGSSGWWRTFDPQRNRCPEPSAACSSRPAKTRAISVALAGRSSTRLAVRRRVEPTGMRSLASLAKRSYRSKPATTRVALSPLAVLGRVGRRRPLA
jgi:hypothetical protein